MRKSGGKATMKTAVLSNSSTDQGGGKRRSLHCWRCRIARRIRCAGAAADRARAQAHRHSIAPATAWRLRNVARLAYPEVSAMAGASPAEAAANVGSAAAAASFSIVIRAPHHQVRFKRKAEAEAHKEKLKVAIRAGTHVSLDNSLTVANAADRWINRVEANERERATLRVRWLFPGGGNETTRFHQSVARSAAAWPLTARAQHRSLAPPKANPFPLSVSANGPYLVTATRAPFLLVADSCQGGAIESVADFT
jgi:hypothetical protein